METNYKLILVKLMLFDILLHSKCCCLNFTEDVEITKHFYDKNNSLEFIHNNNTYPIWRDNSGNETNCIALAAKRISLKLHETGSNNYTKKSSALHEIDLISVNTTTTTVQIESLCHFNPKVLKISLNSSFKEFVIKFHVLVLENSYRLVLVDLVLTVSQEEKGVVKSKSSYLAFRAAEDYENMTENPTEFGSSGYCSKWTGFDAETRITIENLHFQVTKYEEISKNGTQDTFDFNPIGQLCQTDMMSSMGSEERFARWNMDRFKIPVSKFLVNITLLLGGSGLFIGIIFGLFKLCPEKAKTMRKTVFHV